MLSKILKYLTIMFVQNRNYFKYEINIPDSKNEIQIGITKKHPLKKMFSYPKIFWENKELSINKCLHWKLRYTENLVNGKNYIYDFFN